MFTLSFHLTLRHIVFTLALTVVTLKSHAQQQIKLVGPASVAHHSQHFFVDLIKLILSKDPSAPKAYELVLVEEPGIRISREELLIEHGYADLMWSGTSGHLEKALIPVRIPVLGGLLGYRVSIIKRDSLDVFERSGLSEIKKLTVCQAAHWPDSDIFKQNDFQIITPTSIESILKMLNNGKCDYFPRGIHEAYHELQLAKAEYSEFMIYDDTLIHYPFPSYIFVDIRKPELADFLERNFLAAIADLSYLNLMKSHELTKHIFPLKKWQNKNFIKLKNLSLPPLTPLNKPELWFKIH